MSQTITVEGMSCAHCEATVVDALESVTGVTTASADHEAATATVEGDATIADLLAAVDDAGYDATN